MYTVTTGVPSSSAEAATVEGSGGMPPDNTASARFRGSGAGPPASQHAAAAEAPDSRASLASATSVRSSDRRTLNFIRNIVGHRNNDYRSDAPQVPTRGDSGGALAGFGIARGLSRGISSRSNRTRGQNRGSRDELVGGTGGDGGGGGGRTSSWLASLRCCSAPAVENRRIYFSQVINSRLWRVLLIFFTIVLLFGPQIRDLLIPPSGDTAMDAIFTIAFCVFWIDIFMRIDVEPNYFGFNFFYSGQSHRQSSLGAGGSNYSPGNASEAAVGCCNCQFGSFLFWCDLVSTLTLLYSVSFINKRNFQILEVDISLDAYGIPTGGLNEVNQPVPIELEVSLLVTVAKTARVARFIRSSTAVKISSKVNWYWFLNLFNPFWWWRGCCGCGRDPRSAGSATAADFVMRPEHPSERSPGASIQHPSKLMRRSSWGGIGLASLAAVKAKEADAEKKRLSSDSGSPLAGLPLKALRLLGLGGRGDEEWRRQLAATRIQRAWRAVLEQRLQAEFGDRSERDVAWKGRGAPSDNPMEKALHKRSFLLQGSAGKSPASGLTSKRASGSSAGGGDPSSVPSPGANRRSRIPLGVSGSGAAGKRRHESQVGSAMRELTGQRVALGILIALLITVLFTYKENDSTRASTMIVLHTQTQIGPFADQSLDAARARAVPDLYEYEFANGNVRYFTLTNGEDVDDLRDREKLRIQVMGGMSSSPENATVGWFANQTEKRQEAGLALLSTVFILLVWFFGVTAFAGPVMILVVIPIERMVRLLGMLMVDPLGYQGSSRYKRFVAEEDEITKNTRWTKEVLKGMETSFLMSTILRIGSLMKVGFGSAGVEIIRKNLEKGQSKNMLMLSSQGSTVSCIFLFSDIRQFTDATECLQEEVFVFTNRIAAVVHSICHSYGGAANKNIGDAFLLSWLLDEESSAASGDAAFSGSGPSGESFSAKNNQADKAMLSVIKICMALHFDDYYVETMSDAARDALLTKLSKRKGPVVQMGFGLHAGKAVQGAIGSQRKIDATYVSEAVERAEFLESSTKKYGVKMLMSDNFHRLLQPNNRRRCRKVDQILIRNEDDEDEDDYGLNGGDIMELFTFDMDIDALWQKKGPGNDATTQESDGESAIGGGGAAGGTEKNNNAGPTSKRDVLRNSAAAFRGVRRRTSLRKLDASSDELRSEAFGLAGQQVGDAGACGEESGSPELVLPTGPALYDASVWVSEDMRKIRQLYSDGLFFQKFNSGLQAFYAKDWEHARQCFVSILERLEDGPSRYFLTQIETHNGKPPRDFLGYGTA